MKPNDKVRIISSPYSMFEVGSEYTISYVDTASGNPYGIYLTDPFYEGVDESPDSAQWPFHRDEVELVK